MDGSLWHLLLQSYLNYPTSEHPHLHISFENDVKFFLMWLQDFSPQTVIWKIQHAFKDHLLMVGQKHISSWLAPYWHLSLQDDYFSRLSEHLHSQTKVQHVGFFSSWLWHFVPQIVLGKIQHAFKVCSLITGSSKVPSIFRGVHFPMSEQGRLQIGLWSQQSQLQIYSNNQKFSIPEDWSDGYVLDKCTF